MNQVEGLINWLNYQPPTDGKHLPDIVELLQVEPTLTSHQMAFGIEATFQLQGSLLIRSETGAADSAETKHLHSWRNGQEEPILSGTSLAGVIRSRALKIAQTLRPGDTRAEELVDGMFGKKIDQSLDEPGGSRVIVHETCIKNGINHRVQNRVKLDRFTGGAYPQALFSQQPLWGKENNSTQVHIKLEIHKTPKADQFNAEVGLILMVLKDLWTSDLPLGGESSVGRGRLQGEKAALTFGTTTWTLSEGKNGTLTFGGIGSRATLEEQFLKALQQWREAK